MKSPLYSGNIVEFLMDGEEFFGAIRKHLERLAKQTVVDPKKSYARFAFWAIADDVLVGNGALGRVKFIDAVHRVLMAGHNVDIIGWYPNLKTRKLGGHDGKFNAEKHDELAKAIERIDRLAKFANKGRVRFYMERYEGWTGGSQHQKMAIFSFNGQLVCVVGGLNMANYYYDDTAHSNLSGDGRWHDTALTILGPATIEIDKEWLRRWRKAVDMQEKLLTFNDLKNQVRSRYDDNLSHYFSRHQAVAIEENTTEQKKHATPASGSTLCLADVRVCTTRSTTTSHEKDIKELLIEKIRAAETSIYMENVQLTDPDLVKALYRRQQAKPGLTIVMVCCTSGGGSSYCTRRAWLQIALRQPHPQLDSITYVAKQGGADVLKTASRQGATKWNVTDCTEGMGSGKPWPDKDILDFAAADGTTGKLKFSDIHKVDGQFYFLTPRAMQWDGSGYTYDDIMVHSKLCIIDDKVVIVGSANWTYRSMNYDGEMAIFVEKATKLAPIALGRLIRHYQTISTPAPTIGQLQQTAVDNVDAWANGTLPQGLPFVVLLPASHPSFYGSFDDLSFAQWSPTETKHATQQQIKTDRGVRSGAQLKAEGAKRTFLASKKEKKDIVQASVECVKSMPDYTWY